MSCLCLIKYHRKGEKRGEGGGGGGGGSVVFIQGVNGERERERESVGSSALRKTQKCKMEK